MAFGRTINILYLLTYLQVLCHHHSLTIVYTVVITDDALVAYARLYGSTLRHICNAVVWIAELVHVKKSWKLVEISLTTLF